MDGSSEETVLPVLCLAPRGQQGSKWHLKGVEASYGSGAGSIVLLYLCQLPPHRSYDDSGMEQGWHTGHACHPPANSTEPAS